MTEKHVGTCSKGGTGKMDKRELVLEIIATIVIALLSIIRKLSK